MKARTVSEETWPLIVDGSDANSSQKAVIKLLIPDQRYNGSVIFKVHEDDMQLLTKKMRETAKGALEKFFGHVVRDQDVHYSILPDQPKPKNNGKAKAEEPEPLSARQFRKKLGWLIKESPDAVRMTITPEMARVMLERNHSDEWKNRPESNAGVRRYSRRIAAGEWVYTGQTIIFSDTGNLLNGQHTLSACVLANEPIEQLVAFGVDDDAFKFMDSGIHRQASHIFAIDGVKNYAFAASVARLLHVYTKDRGSFKSATVDNDELLEFYHRHPDIQESYNIARAAGKAGLMTPSWAGFLHYICAQKNRSQADEFFRKVIDGIGIESKKSAEHVLHVRLIKNSQSKSDATDAPVYVGAYVVKAWNHKRNGTVPSLLKWRPSTNPNESFPRAI